MRLSTQLSLGARQSCFERAPLEFKSSRGNEKTQREGGWVRRRRRRRQLRYPATIYVYVYSARHPARRSAPESLYLEAFVTQRLQLVAREQLMNLKANDRFLI